MILQDECFVEIATATGPMRTYIFRPKQDGRYAAVIFYSEIFQMTGPIKRFATFLAGHGYLVAVPEVYHELEPAGTVLAYDQAGSDKGNIDKHAKTVASYDGDSRALIDHLLGREDCTGKVGTVGICLGGHLAFRCALNPEITAAACFYATDLHCGTLGAGKNDDSLGRAGDIKGELLHVWGRQDPHVPLEGRTKIRARLDEVNANFQWFEVNGAHAFLRDEGPRYDPELEYQCKGLMLDLFHRRLAIG